MLNNIETIRMHFSEMSGCECKDTPIWIDVLFENVSVKLNLETGDYEFRGSCKGCDKEILNTRRAFK